MSAKIYYFLFVCLLLASALACGGGDAAEEPAVEEPAGEGEAPVAIEAVEETIEEPTLEPLPETGGPGEEPLPVEAPATTEPAESEAAGEETTAVQPPAVPTETATPEPAVTPTPVPLVYSSDGNPCIRTLGLQSVLSAAGQAPLNIDPGDDEDLVLARLPRPYLVYSAFVPSSDSRLLVTLVQPFSGEVQSAIQITNIDSGQDVGHLQSEERFYSLAMSEEAPLLAAIDGKGQIWQWNLNNANSENADLVTTVDLAGHLALSPDGRFIAVTTIGNDAISRWGAAQLFDVATGQELRRFEGEVIDQEAEAGGFGGRKMANGHAANIDWLGFSPNGEALLTLSKGDGTMRLWDINSGEHLRCFELSGFNKATSVSFSPDGREIATASGRKLLLWDTATSQVDRQFGLPEILDVVQGTVAFGPDGDVLLSSARKEQAAYLWDSQTGQLLGLMRHPEFINGAAISPDGRAVATILRNPFDALTAQAWVWNASHPAVGMAAAAQNLVGEGLAFGQRGDIDSMMSALEQAQDLAADDSVLLRPPVWHLACRYGGFEGQGVTVLKACESAVQGTIDQGLGDFTLAKFRDSRGVARALAGDFAGAVEDFQFYIDTLSFDQEGANLRRAWIADLSNGANPFDAATLDALRDT